MMVLHLDFPPSLMLNLINTTLKETALIPYQGW
jgi:hypothetical protein